VLKGSKDPVRSVAGWKRTGEDTKGIASCLIRKGAIQRAVPLFAALTML